MKRNLVNRLLAIVLLVAVVLAVVPLHQIFHKHTYSASLKKGSKGEIRLVTKPCCKPFQTLHQSIETFPVAVVFLRPAATTFLLQPVERVQLTSTHYPNKAPPVVLA